MKYVNCLLACLLLPLAVAAEPNPESAGQALAALAWHVGPATETVAGKATLKTDDTLAFLDEHNSTRFLELTGNLPEPGNFVLFSPRDHWWATFSYSPVGYVKDDETIDADALLRQLKEGEGPANEERKRLGLPPLHTIGWSVPPHYDPQSKRLEWGLELASEEERSLNYTIRLLGRGGIVNATLVSSPESLAADVKSFKTALHGFDFNPGERYAEYRAGDRVAEFGLAALIAGGAAAIATKKGLWAALGGFLAASWKLIVAAFLGLAAWVGSLFKKKP